MTHGTLADQSDGITPFTCEIRNPVRPASEEFTLDQCRFCWLRVRQRLQRDTSQVGVLAVLTGELAAASDRSKLCRHLDKAVTGTRRPDNTDKDWRDCKLGQGPLGGIVCPCGYCNQCEIHDDGRGRVGVVIGCYGMPSMARLQIASIRATCGAVPILLADDCSGRDQEFAAITQQYPGVEFWPSQERRGHYAGDLSVFWKGFQWAHVNGYQWLCKLSQRMLWTVPGWLRSAMDRLEMSGRSVLFQRCVDNGGNFHTDPTDLHCRSESMLFQVEKWAPLWHLFDIGAIVHPTELFMNGRVAEQFGGQFCVWEELTVNRYAPSPGTIWHCTHSPGDYREYAKRFGVELEESFSTSGWPQIEGPGWKAG